MEMRAQVEVYRTQKEEEEQLKRLEDEMRAQMEAEAKKQAIAKNSERIREKVGILVVARTDYIQALLLVSRNKSLLKR